MAIAKKRFIQQKNTHGLWTATCFVISSSYATQVLQQSNQHSFTVTITGTHYSDDARSK